MPVHTSPLCAALGCAAALALASPGLASDPLDALLACRRIEASAARLACFDRLSASLVAHPRPPTTRALAALNPRSTFGLAPTELAARAEAAVHAPPSVNSITARITRLSSAADGREIFVLDNHQVWVQLEDEGALSGAKPGERVTLSRGWLGSYLLSLPSRRGCKVTRLR